MPWNDKISDKWIAKKEGSKAYSSTRTHTHTSRVYTRAHLNGFKWVMGCTSYQSTQQIVNSDANADKWADTQRKMAEMSGGTEKKWTFKERPLFRKCAFIIVIRSVCDKPLGKDFFSVALSLSLSHSLAVFVAGYCVCLCVFRLCSLFSSSIFHSWHNKRNGMASIFEEQRRKKWHE